MESATRRYRGFRGNVALVLGVLMAVGIMMVGLSTGTARAESPVNQVSYSSLTGTELITFDDVAGGDSPGTSYDTIFESGNASFAERFVGQTLTASGDFDILSSTASGPLALQVGASGRNLNILENGGSNVLDGLGPTGFPNADSVGEGAFAVLFDFDQSEFGFQLVGGNGDNATVHFFARDGTLIHTIVVTDLANAFYGFQRDGGVADIAGISVHDDDLGGIGFDNLKHDVAGVVGVPRHDRYPASPNGASWSWQG